MEIWNIRKTSICLILHTLFMALSCGIVEVGAPEDDSNGLWIHPSQGGNGSNPGAKPVCYMTTLEYPPGYNWKSDPEAGQVKCSLVVYADGKAKMKLAVGDKYNVSSDADMHMMVQGHLFTEYSTDTQTIVKQDGVESFRFSGREDICALTMDGTDIYTLGNSRTGSGFSFRKNGQTLLSRKYARAYERLYIDEQGKLSFCFCESVSSQYSSLERHYLVNDTIVKQVAMRDDIRKVWDVAPHGDAVAYIAGVRGIDGLLLVDGEQLTALEIPSGSSVLSARLIPSVECIYVEAVIRTGGSVTTVIWKDGIVHQVSPDGFTPSFCGLIEGNLCCILNSGSGGGIISKDGEISALPAGYVTIGKNPAALVDGILTIGLSSTKGGFPAIWREGDEQTLKINGFISSVSSFGALP